MRNLCLSDGCPKSCTMTKKTNFTEIFLIGCITLTGLFYTYISCLSSAVLCGYLIYKYVKRTTLRWYTNLSSIAILLLVAAYGLTAFWAIDSGMAVIGFFKFLSVLLFAIVLMQQEENSEVFLRSIPYVAAAMTFLSAILMQISALKDIFSVAGRLAGFFGYPNTFALFLLFALIITVTKDSLCKADIIIIPILLFGIVYSGSRTVFVLTAVTVLSLIILLKNKKLKIGVISIVIAAVLGAIIYAALTNNVSAIGRFLTISLKESTFIGRLLYFQDALPIILRHPFGLGYMGYYYIQTSIQTGVYSVQYIHNDFLQMLLDIGWIPTAVFVAALLKAFFKKGTTYRKRLLIFVLCAHCCFDFDLQFVAIFMLLVTIMDIKSGNDIELKISKPLYISVVTVLAVACVYIGCAQAFSRFGNVAVSSKMYPWNTQNDIVAITSVSSPEEMNEIADRILARNKYVTVAYSAKARYAYSKGDFANVIKYKKKAIDTAVFSYDEYEDFCYLLINGIYLYEKHGDDYSANVCRKELVATIKELQKNTERLSKLGRMIDDQPKTQLPDEILRYAENLK